MCAARLKRSACSALPLAVSRWRKCCCLGRGQLARAFFCSSTCQTRAAPLSYFKQDQTTVARSERQRTSDDHLPGPGISTISRLYRASSAARVAGAGLRPTVRASGGWLYSAHSEFYAGQIGDEQSVRRAGQLHL